MIIIAQICREVKDLSEMFRDMGQATPRNRPEKARRSTSNISLNDAKSVSEKGSRQSGQRG